MSFPTGQSLGGHKRKHYFEEIKIISPADGNVKPPILLPHETVPSSGLAFLPTVENMNPPVLLSSDNMQPRKIVANTTVHQQLTLSSDSAQQSQQAHRLGNET